VVLEVKKFQNSPDQNSYFIELRKNFMKCRDFQNEFEERAALSNPAMLHLDSCKSCQKLQFEQTQLLEMLGGLPRIETPKDFNFQLKARIARARPQDYQTGFFPALRYILPLSFAVVLISFVALSGLYFVDLNTASPVAVSETPNLPVNTNFPISSFDDLSPVVTENKLPIEETPISENVSNRLEKKPEIARTDRGGRRDFGQSPPRVISPPVKSVEEENGGGSSDSALTQPKVINPQGFDPAQKVETILNPNVTTTDINNLLDITGVKMDSLKVISVEKNSVADLSGIKIGDVVEAINGNKISGSTISGERIEVRTLTVLRGSERVEIVLQNK
jgi:hypothetical protein